MNKTVPIFLNWLLLAGLTIVFSSAKGQNCSSYSTVTIRGDINNPLFTTSVLTNGPAANIAAGDTTKTIIQAFTWTDNEHGTPFYNGRTLIKFDVNSVSIPAGAILTDAKLYFYAKKNAPDGVAGQPTYGTNNAALLQKVTTPWLLSNTNYNNTPTASTSDQKILPQSTNGAENYVVDIKDFVSYWIGNPGRNYGMLLKMQTENNPYNSMIFECGNAPDSLKPKLVLTYAVPEPDVRQSVIFGDLSSQFKSVVLDNETTADSTKNNIQAFTWTDNEHGVAKYNGRTLLWYDMSSIPANSKIVSAYIYFYANLNASDGVAGQPTYGTNNAGYLQKVTSSWRLGVVDGNHQPEITQTQQKTLAQSTSTAQNYAIAITDFVQGWVNKPDSNFGMLLRMQTENNPYNSLLFASAKASKSLQTRVVVCYKSLLPVVLSNFQGSVTNLSARLYWTTHDEVNFASTGVEKSYDGISFNGIGNIAAKGPDAVNEYSFVDANLAAHSAKVYYRLKLIDKDGKYSYSNTLMLTYQYNSNSVLLFPNPAKSYTQVNLVSEKDEKQSIKVIDILGRTVITQSVYLTKGANEIVINGLANLQKGVYLVQLKVNGNTVTKKIIVD